MKRISVIIICMCITLTMFSQQFGQRQGINAFSPEAFNQRLEEFVQNESDLTPQECQKFFPMMHEMMNKQREINGKIQYTMAKGYRAKTEADYEQIITCITDLEVQSKKIEQIYYKKKFPSVLSWKKIHKVRIALSKFNMEILKHFSPQTFRQGWQGWQSMQGMQGQ